MAETFLKDGGAALGSLAVTVAPHAYDPSAPQKGPQLTLQAGDDFQQGESQGKVRVSGDQLAQPVTIPVSVLRVPTSLVLIPILAGLVLGYVIRVRTEEQIAKKNALVDAGRLLARIAQELASKEDPGLQKELLAIRKEVEDKSAAKAAELRAVLEAAGPKLTKTLTDFETRKSAFIAEAEALLQLVRRKFTLPDTFTNLIESARATLARIVEVPGNNVAEAKKSLAAAEDLLMLGARDAARSWDARWQETKAVVEQLLPLLLPEDRARVQTDFGTADTTHAKVKEFLLSTAPSLQQLQDALEAVHRNNMLLGPFLNGLPLGLQNTIDRLNLEMKDRNRATDPEWVA